MDRERRILERKSHQVDLSRAGNELEDRFLSALNQISDLTLPASQRWAGEDDFFGLTSSIKLELREGEQKKDDKTYFRHPDSRNIHGSSHSCRTTPISWSKQPDLEPKAKSHEQLDRSSREKKNDEKNISSSRLTRSRMQKLELERRKALKRRLFQRYTNIKLKKGSNWVDEVSKLQLGYDRLFCDKPGKDYPYANPMVDCMLTDYAIDNLRDVIVSSQDIEWRMLTPVRPDSEYEEKFFDKLIALHRQRYKSWLDIGFFEQLQLAPFKRTRHKFLIQYTKHRAHTSSLSMGAKLMTQFRVRGERARSIGHLRIQVPRVTLTTDDQPNEQLIASDDEDQYIEDT